MIFSLFIILERKEWYKNWLNESLKNSRKFGVKISIEDMGVFRTIELSISIKEDTDLPTFLMKFPEYASTLMRASNMRFLSKYLGKNARILVFYAACLSTTVPECNYFSKTGLRLNKGSVLHAFQASIVSAYLYGYNIFFIFCEDKQLANQIKNVLMKMKAWLSYLISEWGENGSEIAPIYRQVVKAKGEADQALEDFLSNKRKSVDRLRNAMRREIKIRKKADRILTLYHDSTIFLDEIKLFIDTFEEKGVCNQTPVLSSIYSQIKGLQDKVKSFIILVDKFRKSVSDVHEAMVLARMEEVLSSSEKTNDAVTILNLLLSGSIAFEIVDRGLSALNIKMGSFIPFIISISLWMIFFFSSWLFLRRLKK